MVLLATPFAPRPKELDPVEGVGWGNRASLRLISGPTYHSIELVTDITDPKDIERVEVSLNGSPKVSVTAETLVKLQAHRKNYAQPGRYVISFGDPTLRTKVGVRQTDLVTLQGEIWFVYITLKSKPAGTATPSIRARAQPCTELNLKRIHFLDDSVDRVRVLRDTYEEMNVTKADNAFDLAQSKKEQNQGWFSLDFIRYGFGADGMLNTVACSQLAFELDKSQVGC